MIFQHLTRGALLLAAGVLLPHVVNFPSLIPVLGALMTGIILLGQILALFSNASAWAPSVDSVVARCQELLVVTERGSLSWVETSR